MEDIGPEKWDEALNDELFHAKASFSARDIEKTHEELIDSGKVNF